MFADLFSSFTLGLLTPLTAVCVLPLYPGFLAYLSHQLSKQKENRWLPLLFGSLITLGVIVFMILLGLIFTTLLETSLTNVISIVSPIAFSILALISVLLIFSVDFGSFFPKVHAPITKNPLLTSFIYGLFFGAIVIPCNPAFIAAFFSKAFLIVNPVDSMLSFIAFGFGLGFPLLVLSVIGSAASKKIIGFMTTHKIAINRSAGVIMLVISLYYLFFVFKIFSF